MWEEAGTYRFDDTRPPATRFSPSTRPRPWCPAPSTWARSSAYVQTDAIARYRRMRGWKLFYPMGWDDNGLPTEPTVADLCFGATCDPSLPYDPDFTPPDEPGKDVIPVSRPNFIALVTNSQKRISISGPFFQLSGNTPPPPPTGKLMKLHRAESVKEVWLRGDSAPRAWAEPSSQ